MRRSIKLVIALLMITSIAFAQKPTGYSLKVGDNFSLTRVTDIATTQQVSGQSTEISEVTTIEELLEVTSIANNIITIKATPLRRKLGVTAPMMSQEMDSDRPGEQNLPFKLLVGESYSFTMDKTGTILQIKDIDKMRASIRKKFSATRFAEAADDLLSVFSQEAIKRELEAQFNIYDVSAGNTWTKRMKTVSAEIPTDLNNNYRWGNANTILVNASLAVNGATVISGMNMNFNMTGDQQSTINVDQQNGFPNKIETVQTLKGNMEVQNTNVPTTIVTKVTSTFVKK
ncbi:DUF6263 family protein [Roseivirga sp.]|uniref:DUF6263 family protein n=1 Tax=Roseivirga sp. TaxID=1964215 RepID=UPI003B8AE908